MRKKGACNVIVHIADTLDDNTHANKVSEFYVQIIKRRLNESDLSTVEKITVIDKIIENLKLQEYTIVT